MENSPKTETSAAMGRLPVYRSRFPGAVHHMYRLWLHIEELDGDGEPVGEVVGPVEVADFERLADAEALFDRLLDMEGEPPDLPDGCPPSETSIQTR